MEPDDSFPMRMMCMLAKDSYHSDTLSIHPRRLYLMDHFHPIWRQLSKYNRISSHSPSVLSRKCDVLVVEQVQVISGFSTLPVFSSNDWD